MTKHVAVIGNFKRQYNLQYNKKERPIGNANLMMYKYLIYNSSEHVPF